MVGCMMMPGACFFWGKEWRLRGEGALVGGSASNWVATRE